MAQWYDGFRNGNVELGNAWVVQAGGFHIFRARSGGAGGRFINWLRGDNTANNAITHIMPDAGQNTSISIEWNYLFQFGADAAHDLSLWLFTSEAVNFPIPGTLTGYYIYISAANFRLYRRDAGATVNRINMDASWAIDTNEHKLKVTREVSGAGRLWRVYLDDIQIGGGAGGFDDVTYSNANSYGFQGDARDQFGEILISS